MSFFLLSYPDKIEAVVLLILNEHEYKKYLLKIKLKNNEQNIISEETLDL